MLVLQSISAAVRLLWLQILLPLQVCHLVPPTRPPFWPGSSHKCRDNPSNNSRATQRNNQSCQQHHNTVRSIVAGLFWGAGGVAQYHVGGDIFCNRCSMDESMQQRAWQYIDTLGTECTIAKSPAMMSARCGGWSLPDRALVGAAELKCPAADARQ